MSSERKKQVVSLPKYTKEAGRAHTFHAKGERKSVISLHLFQFISKMMENFSACTLSTLPGLSFSPATIVPEMSLVPSSPSMPEE